MQKLIKTLLALVTSAFLVFVFGALTVNMYQNHQTEQAIKTYEEKIQSDIPRYVVAPHVIRIDITLPNGIKYSGGTGFHVEYGDKVVLVTNKHVCDPTLEGFELRHGDNKLEVVHITTLHDLCILKSDRLSGLKLASILDTIEVLDKVILVGHPRGLDLTVREGRVMKIGLEVFPWVSDRPLQFFEISTITYGGNSGSPVTNSKGEVIGVLFAGYRNFHTEGMVVPLIDLYVLLATYYDKY